MALLTCHLCWMSSALTVVAKLVLYRVGPSSVFFTAGLRGFAAMLKTTLLIGSSLSSIPCRMDPKALLRSSHTMTRFFLLCFASFIAICKRWVFCMALTPGRKPFFSEDIYRYLTVISMRWEEITPENHLYIRCSGTQLFDLARVFLDHPDHSQKQTVVDPNHFIQVQLASTWETITENWVLKEDVLNLGKAKAEVSNFYSTANISKIKIFEAP